MSRVVETTHGRIAGTDHGTHCAFRGIPFAAPPIGERRFSAPAPMEPWAGVREALEPGPAAPQPPSLLLGTESGRQSEDCLTLNVYTPGREPARRPVLVWIHGGAFLTGSGGQTLYDGGRLAARGDLVVVTINYRLGALGYLHPLAEPGWEDAAANRGQLDQIAALRWVRDNIAAFGGDPSRVTVAGESAGGMATTTLLAMPQARGLFHRAVVQSGAAQATLQPDRAERVTLALLDDLGAPRRHALRALREVPTETLLAAQARVIEKLQPEHFLVFAPVVDAAAVPEHPLEAVRRGAAADLPLIVGTTRDEWRLFTFAVGNHRRLDDAALLGRVRSRLHRLGREDAGSAAARIIATYRASDNGTRSEPWQLFDAIESDRMFRIPAIQLAEAQRRYQAETRMYLFAWGSPAAHGRLGACHGIELPFLFGTLDAPGMARFAGAGPEAESLSGEMMDAWAAFAHGPTPSPEHAPTWPSYDSERRATLVFDRTTRLIDAPMEAERRAWAG